MDVRAALVEQYLAGLAMLRMAVEACPEHLWVAGSHPRTFWRIAWHTLFFTELYLVQEADRFPALAEDWPTRARTLLGVNGPAEEIRGEPYELPEGTEPLTKAELLELVQHLKLIIKPTVDGLNLDRSDSGFHWYPNMTKLSHELLNLRHLQGHVGQLSELLMAEGIELDWVARGLLPE